MKKDFSPVRGTFDYLPGEVEVREAMREKILKCYRRNGFMQIQTPVFESLHFLDNSDGGDNLKLMFKTIKRGRDLDLKKPNLTEADVTEEGLRYDLTVPLVRMFCNNREALPLPFKAIQLDFAFRAEKPQRGRNRQFIQCDVDVIGDPTENAEIEVLLTVLEALDDIGLKNLVVKINDRRILNALILNSGFDAVDISSVCISLDKLDKIEVKGVREELLGKKFAADKVEKLLKAIEDIKKGGLSVITNYGVTKEVADSVKKIIDIVSSLNKNAAIVYEISIIRGQGYYTGTVFEVYADGMRGAVAGGGRYDNMVETMAGVKQPAAGISIGFEPITILARELGLNIGGGKKIALLYDNNGDFLKVLEEKKKFVKEGYDCTVYKTPRNVKALLEKLKNCGVTSYKFFGKDEVKAIN